MFLSTTNQPTLEIAALPFVIPTEAQRSGGICSAPLGPPEFFVTNLQP